MDEKQLELENAALSNRVEMLGRRLAHIKARHEFDDHYTDGHVPSADEMTRHYYDLRDKIHSDVDSFESKNGHINRFEEQLIVFIDSLED